MEPAGRLGVVDHVEMVDEGVRGGVLGRARKERFGWDGVQYLKTKKMSE